MGNGLWATVYGQRSMGNGLWSMAFRPSPFFSSSLSPFDSLTLPLLVPLTLPLFVSSSLCLFDSLSLCLLFEKFRKKTNNFEPFFSDSTLTFLTYENTFRLPILPTRRAIFLCLPLIKI